MSVDVTHYDTVIFDLEARRDQLTATIENLRAARSMLASGPGTPATGGASQSKTGHCSEPDFARDAFFGKGVAEAARMLLVACKRTRSNADLCEGLRAGGLTSASKNFVENVRTILSRHSDFVRVNGEWGLVEWYPGYRGKKRKPQHDTEVEGHHVDDAQPAALFQSIDAEAVA